MNRSPKTKPYAPLDRQHQAQRGGILMKFTGLVLLLTVGLVVGGILYLGSADLPAPSQTVQIPVSDDAIRPQ